MIRSAVKKIGGVPALTVNGKHIPAEAFMTYYPPKAGYLDFAQAGFKLYSVPVFFAGQTINEFSRISPLARGIFDEKEPDYSVFEENIKRILDVCPDAMILPRVNVSVSAAWEDAHPEELTDIGLASHKRVCFSSDAWAEETKRTMKLFIEKIEQSEYADNIIGYQISGGNTEEWFSFDRLGSIGKRSREKFAETVKLNKHKDTEEEYYTFLSEIVAERIIEFAGYAKKLTGGRLVVGSFYGYTLECPERTSCHHALRRLLSSPEIDFICSPISYSNYRSVGLDHPNMLPIDSVKLSGKLYFVENDTRTHLSGVLNNLPYYLDKRVWCGPEKEISLEIMKMHFSRALTHGHAMWWFDMWGGWYADDEYMNFISSSLQLLEKSLDLPMSSISDVAVFVDEKAYCKIRIEDEKRWKFPHNIRKQLGLAGAPYDIYLADDFYAVKEKYKCCIFLVPEITELVQDAINIARESGMVLTPENSEIKTETLRDFYKKTGVRLRSDRDAVIYANESFLFIHAPENGEYNISLPEGKKATELNGESVSMPLVCKKQTSHLFYLK